MGKLRTVLTALAGFALFAPAVALGQGLRVPAVPMTGVEKTWAPKTALAEHRLLEKSLDALAPQRPGKRDVYILAAGLWGEHVFDSETSQAAAILAKHFGAEGRTVALSNFPQDEGRAAATPNHIAIALARIGEVMDPKEDVAVVFLTSHGAQNLGIAVSEPNRMEYRVTPASLRLALDDAGLQNRIVILSACFAGQFIPALSGPKAVVLTAASPDRTSFGCQPERDWTYFGDALFNQSLKDGTGLLAAFDKAQGLISQWEQRDNLIPSLPLRFVGAEAQAYLTAIEGK